MKLFPLLLIALAGVTQANEPPSGWLLGIGGVVAPDPFVGNAGTQGIVLPLVGYLGERLEWIGPQVRYRLAGDGPVSLALRADARFEGFDHTSNDPRLATLKRRRMAVETGVEVGLYGLTWSLTADPFGVHEGWQTSLGFNPDISLGREWTVSAGVGVTYRSRKLANYYFGVEAEEASALTPEYEVGDALGYMASIGAQYHPSDRWMLMVEAQREWFDRDIEKSPIIADGGQNALFMGLIYRFAP